MFSITPPGTNTFCVWAAFISLRLSLSTLSKNRSNKKMQVNYNADPKRNSNSLLPFVWRIIRIISGLKSLVNIVYKFIWKEQ